MLEVLQCYSSSPFKLEDQNCLTWPGNVLTVEDDYSNFGVGNIVNPFDLNPRTGHLVYGWEMDL